MWIARALTLTLIAVTVPTEGVCQPCPVGQVSDGRSACQPSRARPPAALAQLNESLKRLASSVSPAVVQIAVTGLGPADSTRRVEPEVIARQHAVGAGIVVDPDGYIMTNAHVVEGAERIRVVVSVPVASPSSWAPADRSMVLEARVVGTEPLADLALLKVEGARLPTVRFNLDTTPQPGELVFAVGSPSGLHNSITMGVISSAWRQPDADSPMVFLQTDAPINPGNSGGPLVDVDGAVVGLNTFIVSRGGGSNGLGFAIPARIVDFVYRSLRKSGRVEHADIGAFAQTITPAMADVLGLAQDWGVVIADVLPGGPADIAGLLPGDVVVAVDATPVPGLTAFTVALYQHPPAQPLVVEVLRGPRTLSFTVPVLVSGHRPDQLGAAAALATSRIEPLGILGLDFDRVRALLSGARIENGVFVVGFARGFDSVDTGLRAGDLIHAVNRTPVESIRQLEAALGELRRGQPVVVHVERQGQLRYLTFELQ